MDDARPTWRSPVLLVVITVLAVLVLALTTAGVDPGASPWAALAILAAVIVVALGGASARIRSQRRRYEEELAAWAAHQATQAERLRIARELHDLVSHGLGLITVRASAALRVSGPDADTEREDALADIERASRQTMTELRRMLAVLRTRGPVPLRPCDTLEDLPAIVEEAGACGLKVTWGTEDLGEVSAGVQLTVCAVVREGLSNALRHAGPTGARVRLRRDAGDVVVDVDDDGPLPGWRPHPGAGRGLDGVRERAEALGGALHVRTGGTGWALTVRLPDRGGA
jgi:two-component system sensor histidine kinase DesK